MIVAIEGMDGVGKTTACKLLAERLGYKFVEKNLHFLFDENDKYIISQLEGKNVIALINKTEDGCAFDENIIKNKFENTIMFSVHTQKGKDELCECVKRIFDMGKIYDTSGAVITNIRHKEALLQAKEYSTSALNALKNGIPCDMISIDIQNTISSLGEITGLTVAEEVVDKIFHDFCLGK